MIVVPTYSLASYYPPGYKPNRQEAEEIVREHQRGIRAVRVHGDAPTFGCHVVECYKLLGIPFIEVGVSYGLA